MARRKGPKYVVRNLAGEEVAGSDTLDDALRGSAAKQLGQIVEVATGAIVYSNTPTESELDAINKENTQ